MPIYWRVKSIKELDDLPAERRQQIWEAAKRRGGTFNKWLLGQVLGFGCSVVFFTVISMWLSSMEIQSFWIDPLLLLAAFECHTIVSKPFELSAAIDEIPAIVGDLCPHCGYDLRASPAQCPECGRPKRAVKQRSARSASDLAE